MSLVHLWDAVWKDVLAFAIGASLSWLVGRARVVRFLRKHEATQELIADRLSTKTAGGLQDVVESNERLYRAYTQASPGVGRQTTPHSGKR